MGACGRQQGQEASLSDPARSPLVVAEFGSTYRLIPGALGITWASGTAVDREYTPLAPQCIASATIVIAGVFAIADSNNYLKFVTSTASLDSVPRAIAICFPSLDQANDAMRSETKWVSGYGEPPETS